MNTIFSKKLRIIICVGVLALACLFCTYMVFVAIPEQRRQMDEWIQNCVKDKQLNKELINAMLNKLNVKQVELVETKPVETKPVETKPVESDLQRRPRLR